MAKGKSRKRTNNFHKSTEDTRKEETLCITRGKGECGVDTIH